MKKVKAFFYVFFRSLLPQSAYYEDISKSKFLFSLKYFIVLLIVLNTLFISTVAIRLHPAKINRLLESLQSSLSQYPQNLSLTLHRGLLISSFNRPYFLWLDYDNKTNLLVVVDENASVDKIKDYNSSLLLTSKYLVIKNMRDENASTVIPLSRFSDQIIDKTAVLGVQSNIQKADKVFPVLFWSVFVFLLIVLPTISFFLNLFYLIMASLLVIVVLKMFSKKYAPYARFGKTLQLSFHAITLPLTLDYGLTLLSIKSKPSSLLFFFLTAVFVFAAVYEAYYSRVSHHTPAITAHHPPHRLRKR